MSRPSRTNNGNDFIGQQFSHLTVLKISKIKQYNGTNKVYQYLCRCECGKKIHAFRWQLRYKYKQSCGCKKLKYKDGITIFREEGWSYRLNRPQCIILMRHWDLLEKYGKKRVYPEVEQRRFRLMKADVLILPLSTLVPKRLLKAFLSHKELIFQMANDDETKQRISENELYRYDTYDEYLKRNARRKVHRDE